MRLSKLRYVKDRAYAVDVRLEWRVAYLESSPHAVAWDPFGDRLLYHRAEWRYAVVLGTDDVYDPGEMITTICALPRSKMPLRDVSQGSVVAVLERETLTEEPGGEGGGIPFTWERVVDAMAVESESGIFVVYSRRNDVDTPYVTTIQSFTKLGDVISAAEVPQQVEAVRWIVPHCLVHAGNVYALERDLEVQPPFGHPSARVVRRGLGTLGSAVFEYAFGGDPNRYPQSLAIDPESSLLWVISNQMVDPGGPTAHQETYLTQLSLPGLTFQNEQPLSFGIDLPSGFPYHLGDWGTGARGGNTLFDGMVGGITPLFLEVGAVPEGEFDFGLFRWMPIGAGLLVETVGDGLPNPMFRFPGGLIGAYFGELPQTQEI